MLRKNAAKQKLCAGETVCGLFASIPSPVSVEMIGCAGYDFVIIDTEHVCINPETLEHMIRAAEAVGLTALVRVPDGSSGPILRALDAGAQGVVVPHVRTKEEAVAAVAASRYYPLGSRSLNGGRPAAFGKSDLQAYIAEANEQVLVVAMIEDREGVERIGEILSVPGIDMVLEGAADLSQSYGVPWQTRAPVVREALHTLQEAAITYGVPYCAIPRADEDILTWYDKGVRAFVLGDERGIAFRALVSKHNDFASRLESFGGQKGNGR
ncbi:HpcH/HpaI aldolase family protein [Paenibacillus alkalitolerans]|uniref:HpcH/HpaI aldolase family protein n=1 Tax=Paenibacillus alkalitolerans TaxID=2799335 RepID=UPI0018F6E325|nr:aldolase/citrate lyase family protein [Paenibacillus alkalitolerans]